MTIRTPSWLQAGSFPAENDRLLLKSLLGGSANQTPANGVVGIADLAITASPTPDMHVHAAAGAAFIIGSETTTQGVYGFVADAAVDIGPLAASDATNDRISLIVAQVLDAGYSGASNIGQIVEVAGVPASSPVPPATPKNAIVLAQVRVPKLATTIITADITDVRPHLVNPRLTSTYRAEMYRNAAWTIGTSDTLVQFDTVAFDPGAGCTTGASAGYTCPVAGVYEVDGAFQATANSLTIVRLDKNGAVVRQVGVNNTLAGNITGFYFSYLCAAGDLLQIALRASAASSAMATGQILAYTGFRLASGSS